MFSKSKYPNDGNRRYDSRPPETTLLRSELFIERKDFVLALKENSRGRFLRIAEHTGNRPPNSIIVPSSGLAEFHKLFCEMLEADSQIPPKGNAA